MRDGDRKLRWEFVGALGGRAQIEGETLFASTSREHVKGQGRVKIPHRSPPSCGASTGSRALPSMGTRRTAKDTWPSG